MAKELSQEEVLDFLCQGGGKVPNASLLAHFKHFLRDPHVAGEQLLKRRDRFKRYVNSVAVVKQEGAVKYVVLRSRYRDLLGEDLTLAIPDEPVISDNRENQEIGSQVTGGRWSRQDEGYHPGEPALLDHHKGAPMTFSDPDWNVNGASDGKIRHGHLYTETQSRLQQPSSQPPSSSADHTSTAPLSKTSSSVNNACLSSRDAFPHGTIEVFPSSRTFSQQPSDTSLAAMKTSSSPGDYISSKTSSSATDSSIPSTKNPSSPGNTSIPFTKNSSSATNTSITSTKNSSSPGNTSIPSTRNSSPGNTSIPSTRNSSPGNNSLPSTRNSSPCNNSLPSTKNSSPVNTSLTLTKNSSPANTFITPTENSSSPGNASIPLTKNSSTLANTSIPSTRNSSPVNTSILSTKNPSLPAFTPTLFTKNYSSLIDNTIPSINTSSPSNTSIPFTKTSSPPSDASIPATNTSSPSSDASIPATNTSSPHSDASIPTTKTSSPPSDASIPSTKTSSPPSDTSIPSTKTSSPPSDTSIPSTKTFSPPSDISILFNKTTSPPSNACTKNSEPLSSTSSQYKDYYPTESLSVPYSKNSSFSCAQNPSLSQSPFPGASEQRRSPAGGDHRTATTNPAFISASCRGQQEQKLGGNEIQTTNFEMIGTFPQEVHSEQQDISNYIKEQQRHGFYEDLAASPHSRYMNSTHPSSSLLLPLESSITPLDMQLEEYNPASPCPSPPLLLNDMRDLWMCQMPVFKSIRCQLSLQDMEDFVDQESCGSEGSDSGEGGDCDTEHKDDEDFSSDSNTEKYTQYIEQKCENTRRCPPNRKFLSIIEQYSKLESGDLLGAKDTLVDCDPEPSIHAENKKSPYIAKSFLTDQAPILFELARHPPKHRASSRFQELMSSSDDELIDRDFSRRRRPSRTKRPPDIVIPPQPDVDLLLITKPLSNNKLTVNLEDQKDYQAQYVPKANVDFLLKKSFNYKSCTVPLDPAEHDWIVKSASGSWLQVYGLFSQDPQLVLRKDFISGYTVLHWFAKHGAIEMFHKFVAGAKKAGIELDLNIKSNGGYTPLHIAAIHGHHKVAAMLVERLQVNVKLRDNSGKRAWQYLNCNTSGEVWRLLGAPKGKTIFASRTLNTTYFNTQNKSSQINRKTSLAAFLKPQHQKWKANNHPLLREREIYSD